MRWKKCPRRKRKRRRDYKIQEVIKRRQIILVQVVKEERGNKGVALTTYLSLAGRYCVLMPNTARGGGISRKITDIQDRRRLKEVAKSIDVPEGTGLIVRTAGANRTKTEIKRDFDYLLRLWENVRDLTLKSTAPSLVYEEGSLIKRSIRDLYNKDVESVVVEGEGAYKEAKDFMKMLMPSHARNVKIHKDPRPLFSRNQIDSQLDGLFSPQVTLPSGGYLVINQTEALVAIDVNSGKSTREHSIETTALKTNLEAAQEVGRQLRLRDLAGLIVIDFIDMEEKRNNRKVEGKLKEVLKSDRARIQVGRISPFGLLEMSRQRMRSGVLEGSTRICDVCEGRGYIRSVESCALSVLRGIEDHLLNRRNLENLAVRCQEEVALYILNQKRDNIGAIETAYGITVYVETGTGERGSDFSIAKADGPARSRVDSAQVVSIETAFSGSEAEAASVARSETRDGDEEGQPKKRKRRRGRRGGRRSRSRAEASADQTSPAAEAVAAAQDGQDGGEEEGRGRRRRKRGSRKQGAQASEPAIDLANAPQPEMDFSSVDDGDPWDTTPEPVKRKKKKEVDQAAEAEEKQSAEVSHSEPSDVKKGAEEAPTVAEADEKPKRRRSAKKAKTEKLDVDEEKASAASAKVEESAAEEPKKPRRRRATKKNASEEAGSEDEASARAPEETVSESAEEEQEKPKARKRRMTKKKALEEEKAETKVAAQKAEKISSEGAEDLGEKPKTRRRASSPTKKKKASGKPKKEASEVNGETAAVATKETEDAPSSMPPPETERPARRGWWQRNKG